MEGIEVVVVGPAELVLLVASAGAASLLGHAAYAMLFSSRAVVAGYARARRWIEGSLAALFGGEPDLGGAGSRRGGGHADHPDVSWPVPSSSARRMR